jgi:hypothetical protein
MNDPSVSADAETGNSKTDNSARINAFRMFSPSPKCPLLHSYQAFVVANLDSNLICKSQILFLQGFAEGADDFVTKPFSMWELVARADALLRRSRVLA